MDLELKGKNAIVTGSTAGIGQAIALELAAEGANVAICGRNADGVEEMLAQLQDYPVKSIGGVVDVSDAEAFPEWVNTVAAEMGTPDILVANVNGAPLVEGEFTAPDVMSSIRAIRTVIPWLKESEAGSIVYIGSIAGVIGVPQLPEYGAGKAALTHYMKSLAQELIPFGIRVNTVSPGDIFFPGGAWDRFQQTNPERFKAIVERNPRGTLGTREEVAKVVSFIASPAASLVNGGHLIVDGCCTQHVHF